MAQQVNIILNSFLTFCLHVQLVPHAQWGPDMLPGYISVLWHGLQ